MEKDRTVATNLREEGAQTHTITEREVLSKGGREGSNGLMKRRLGGSYPGDGKDISRRKRFSFVKVL